MLTDIMFYLFASVCLASACGVVAMRNPVHAVLFLILAFFNAAGLMLLVGAEFLAFIVVIVYVGAVAVLFLFMVMMLDIGIAPRRRLTASLPVGLLVGGVLLAELLVAVRADVFAGLPAPLPAADSDPSSSNAHALGMVLYTDYFVFFQLAGAILLTAMVGAIVLTVSHRAAARRQETAAQLLRRKEDALRLVDVKPGQGI